MMLDGGRVLTDAEIALRMLLGKVFENNIVPQLSFFVNLTRFSVIPTSGRDLYSPLRVSLPCLQLQSWISAFPCAVVAV